MPTAGLARRFTAKAMLTPAGSRLDMMQPLRSTCPTIGSAAIRGRA